MMKFYKCATCGKIIAVVKETPVETVCCGAAMTEIVANTTDGSQEHHVPVCTCDGNGQITVKVGAKDHPMLDAHSIEWIAIETDSGRQRRCLRPGERPQATFMLLPGEKVRCAFAYCNLHGLWKACCEKTCGV